MASNGARSRELLRGRCCYTRPRIEEGRVREVAQDHVLREGVEENTKPARTTVFPLPVSPINLTRGAKSFLSGLYKSLSRGCPTCVK